MRMGKEELTENEFNYLPPHVELIYVNVEQGFAGSTGGGTENYVPGDEIEF